MHNNVLEEVYLKLYFAYVIVIAYKCILEYIWQIKSNESLHIIIFINTAKLII